MHITPEFAGLLAQVYPALLIAVLLEGRVHKSQKRGFIYKFDFAVRFFAIPGATISTFFCLYSFGAKVEDVAIDFVVTISGGLLLLSVIGMASTIVANDALTLFFPDEEDVSSNGDKSRV